MGNYKEALASMQRLNHANKTNQTSVYEELMVSALEKTKKHLANYQKSKVCFAKVVLHFSYAYQALGSMPDTHENLSLISDLKSLENTLEEYKKGMDAIPKNLKETKEYIHKDKTRAYIQSNFHKIEQSKKQVDGFMQALGHEEADYLNLLHDSDKRKVRLNLHPEVIVDWSINYRFLGEYALIMASLCTTAALAYQKNISLEEAVSLVPSFD